MKLFRIVELRKILMKCFFFVVLGFNVEIVEYKNISFIVWDVGG